MSQECSTDNPCGIVPTDSVYDARCADICFVWNLMFPYPSLLVAPSHTMQPHLVGIERLRRTSAIEVDVYGMMAYRVIVARRVSTFAGSRSPSSAASRSDMDFISSAVAPSFAFIRAISSSRVFSSVCIRSNSL